MTVNDPRGDARRAGLMAYSRAGFNRRWIFQDWRVNAFRPRIRIILMLFRAAQAARWPFDRPPSIAARLLSGVYYPVSSVLLGVELPVKTVVGEDLQIAHGFGLVVNVDTVIGRRVLLRHGVTLGNTGRGGRSPVIGDDVSVGAHAIVLGPIIIGEGATIGAGSLVVESVPAGGKARAQPARVQTGEVPS